MLSMQVHELLKVRTHAAHVRINHHPMLAGILRADYPQPRYWQVLWAYSHFYQALENAIVPYLAQHPCGFDYTPRIKTGWLLQDLAWGGIDSKLAPWRPDTEPWKVQIEDAAQLAGLLYPIEGATLGAQVIRRGLLKNHGLTPESGARFFSAYGDQTALRWQEFLAFAAQVCQSPQQCERAADQAVQVFQQIEALLDNCGKTCARALAGEKPCP
jgi:heme oxygenase